MLISNILIVKVPFCRLFWSANQFVCGALVNKQSAHHVAGYRIQKETFWHSRGVAKNLDFGSAKACTLPGNICPTGGAHTGSTPCADNPLSCGNGSTPEPEDVSTDELTDIVTKAVMDILSRPGSR